MMLAAGVLSGGLQVRDDRLFTRGRVSVRFYRVH